MADGEAVLLQSLQNLKSFEGFGLLTDLIVFRHVITRFLEPTLKLTYNRHFGNEMVEKARMMTNP